MKKFLSLILALTLVASLFTVNVMADSVAHNVTISADKTTGLKAGDTVTIELKMDNTFNIKQCGYILTYDKDAFDADNTKVSRLEACIDKPWLDSMKDPDGDWAYYLGNPIYNVGIAGELNFQWAGSAGVEAEYAMDNRLIGKFYLTVADGAQDGTYTFALTGTTTDAGENYGADMVSTPITVTVGEEKQEATPSVNTEFGTATAAGIAANRGGVEFVYDNAYAVTVKMSNTNEATKAGIQFIPAKVLASNGNSWDDAAEAVFTTGLGAGEAEFTAALINIPRKFAGQTIKMMARGFVVVGENTITGKEVEKDITYTVTAEPGQN